MEIDHQTLLNLEKSVTVAARNAAKAREKEIKKERRLNEQQEEFCQLFVKYGGDHRRAYAEAGYSTDGKTWQVEAARMKSRPNVFRRIQELREVLLGSAEIDEAWILRKARQFVDKAYLNGQLKDGIASLELIAKIVGLLKGDSQAAKAGILQQINLFSSGSEMNDIKRLARAANLQIIDVESVDVKNVENASGHVGKQDGNSNEGGLLSDTKGSVGPTSGEGNNSGPNS